MKISMLLVCLLSAGTLFAKKDTVVVYYTASMVEVKKKDFYSLYRKYFHKADNTLGFLEYDRSDKLRMSGAYESSAKDASKTGVFVYYHTSYGVKIKEEHYVKNIKEGVCKTWYDDGARQSEGYYLNDKQSGDWKGWYRNGNPSYEGSYAEGKQHGTWKHWYVDGKPSSVQIYNMGNLNGASTYWFKNGFIEQEGVYKEGNRDGIWKFYFETGTLSALEEYADGKAIKIEFWDESGNPENPAEPDKLEIDPQFDGGEMAMMKFIRENILYPEISREMGAQGTVYIRFIVGIDGELHDFEVVKSAGDIYLDKEALRVLKKMPAWIPGVSHNRIMETTYVLPIKFSIA